MKSLRSHLFIFFGVESILGEAVIFYEITRHHLSYVITSGVLRHGRLRYN